MSSTNQYDRSKVVNIVNSVIAKMATSTDSNQDAVIKELRGVLDVIQVLRADISGLRPQDVTAKHVPGATDELDAVITATKTATDTIMSSCEAMEKAAAGKSDPLAQAVNDEVTKIYEACSFQDITGQRIKKVVGVLEEIQTKVEHLLEVIGHTEDHVSQDTRVGDAKLMNGPQMPANAISQDDIDKLLASFD
jgi:chemotaxis protein CheZ